MRCVAGRGKPNDTTEMPELLTPRMLYLEAREWIPLPLKEVHAFFSEAQNLEKITPPEVGFTILSALPIVMRAGALIEYRVKLFGVPMRWSSKITEWNPPHDFTDEQVRGPYAVWLHTHSFREENGGTLLLDSVKYAVPFSWLPGVALVERFLVRPELKRIFEYRKVALRQHFSLKDSDLPHGSLIFS
jgi:ligand-binding SRPBCC domain-containing protein